MVENESSKFEPEKQFYHATTTNKIDIVIMIMKLEKKNNQL